MTTEISMTSHEHMTVYVVYENPTDYPGKFVIRRNYISRGTSFDQQGGARVTVAPEPDFIADTYNDLAEWLISKIRDEGLDLHRFARDPTDPPQIREVWL